MLAFGVSLLSVAVGCGYWVLGVGVGCGCWLWVLALDIGGECVGICIGVSLLGVGFWYWE